MKHKFRESIAQSKPIRIKFKSEEKIIFKEEKSKPELKKKKMKYFERSDLPYKNYKYIKLNLKNTEFEYLTKLDKFKSKEKKINEKTIESTLRDRMLEDNLVKYGANTMINKRLDNITKRFNCYFFFNDLSIDKKYKQEMIDKEIKNKKVNSISSWSSPFLLKEKKSLIGNMNLNRPNGAQNSTIHPSDELTLSVITINQILDGQGQTLKSKLDSFRGKNKQMFPRIQSKKNPLVVIKEWNLLARKQELENTRISHLNSQSYYKKVVDRKSNESNSSSRKDLQLLEDIYGMNKSHQMAQTTCKIYEDNSFISRETFYSHFQLFWDVIRKEDELAERVGWAISLKNESKFLNLQGLQRFYNLFVNCDSTEEDQKLFVFDFFIYRNEEYVKFIEIQQVLRLLLMKYDANLLNVLLEKIVERIHRPSLIDFEMLHDLIQHDDIPSQLIIRLLINI